MQDRCQTLEDNLAEGKATLEDHRTFLDGVRREPNEGGINGCGRFINVHVAAATFVAGHRCTNAFLLPNSATPIYATPIWQRERERQRQLDIQTYRHACIYTYIHICMCVYIYIYGSSRGVHAVKREQAERRGEVYDPTGGRTSQAITIIIIIISQGPSPICIKRGD